MTIPPVSKPLALPRGGAAASGRRQVEGSIQKGPASQPKTPKKPDKRLPSYALGDLVFWDKNGDGKFRFVNGDYVTKGSKKLRWFSQEIKATLKPLGIKYAWHLNPITQFIPEKAKQAPAPNSVGLMASAPPSLQQQRNYVGEAMISGDYGLFQEELKRYEQMLEATGDPLNQETAKALREEARMVSFLKEAAESLLQDREDLALSALQRSHDHAKKAGVPWQEETLLFYFDAFGEGKIPAAQIHRILDQLESTQP